MLLWWSKGAVDESMIEQQIRTDIMARLPRLTRGADNVHIVEEMEICFGRARVDMAIIAEGLIGIEIKGPDDTLARLPGQVQHYSRCFDHIVLVVDESHVTEATKIVPRCWGIVIRKERNGMQRYSLKRQSRPNRRVEIEAVLALLWRDEIISIANALLGSVSNPKASKKALRQVLLDRVPPHTLKSASLAELRNRENWRSVRVDSLLRSKCHREGNVVIHASGNPGGRTAGRCGPSFGIEALPALVNVAIPK